MMNWLFRNCRKSEANSVSLRSCLVSLCDFYLPTQNRPLQKCTIVILKLEQTVVLLLKWASLVCSFLCVHLEIKYFETKTFLVAISDTVESMLSDYDILSLSSIQQHSLKKRDLQPETHVERLLSFSALQR